MIRKKKSSSGIPRMLEAIYAQIEKLAAATAAEFSAIHEELRVNTEQHIELFRRIDHVDAHLSVTATQWHDDFEAVASAVEDHERRMHGPRSVPS